MSGLVMESSLRDFAHPALPDNKSFRLLNLSGRRSVSSGIHCTLLACRIGEAPVYSALSYTWGPAAYSADLDEWITLTSHDIYINNTPFKVSETLFEALTELTAAVEQEANRTGASSGYNIWIDAICINQADNAEKAQQVLLMGDIYNSAQEVVIWLGPKGPGFEDFKWCHTVLLEAVFEIHEQCRVRGDRLPSFDRLLDDVDFHRQLNEQSIRARCQASADFLESRRWFRRAWVIQEVALAKTAVVACGEFRVHWDDIVRLEEFMLEDEASESASTSGAMQLFGGRSQLLNGLRLIVESYQEGRMTQPPAPAFRSRTADDEAHSFAAFAIFAARNADAGRLHDKVYCILGMVGLIFRNGPRLVEPSYDAPVEYLYQKVTEKLLSSLSEPTILSAVEDPSLRRLGNLPSWVPDFSTTLYSPPLPIRVSGYKAGIRHSKRSVGPMVKANVLTLSGAYIDPITAVCPHTMFDIMQNHRFVACLEFCLNLPTRYRNGQTRLEAVWRTMILDVSITGTFPAPAEMGRSFQNFATTSLAIAISEYVRGGDLEREAIAKVKTLLHRLANPISTGTSSRTTTGPIMELPELSEVVEYHRLGTSVRHMTGPERGPAYQKLVAFGEQAQAFRQASTGPSPHRRLFVTSKGFLGMGPASAKPGDEVWLVEGARVPFVFRPNSVVDSKPAGPPVVKGFWDKLRGGASRSKAGKGKEKPTYTMIGETYLHGVMSGELLDGKLGMRMRMEEVQIV